MPIIDDKSDITRGQVLSKISWDEKTGLVWSKPNGIRIGKPSKDGYCRITLYRHSYLVHVLAFLIKTNQYPVAPIIHLDGNRGNNAWENLALSDNATVRARVPKPDRKGYCKSGKWYKAQISTKGRTVYLGLFTTPEEATAAHLEARRKIYGEQ